MRLWCTARREIVPFTPGRIVTMYTCGITPYDATHLGHATVYVTYDVLQRRLRDLGHETRCVRNITDVDDSILGKARELGVHYLDLAAAETARFDDDLAALGLLPAWSEPRATSAIPDIRGFIGMVLDQGHAYQAGGGVYFDVSTFPDFGSVSGYSREVMLEYARERGGSVDFHSARFWASGTISNAVTVAPASGAPPSVIATPVIAGRAAEAPHSTSTALTRMNLRIRAPSQRVCLVDFRRADTSNLRPKPPAGSRKMPRSGAVIAGCNRPGPKLAR